MSEDEKPKERKRKHESTRINLHGEDIDEVLREVMKYRPPKKEAEKEEAAKRRAKAKEMAEQAQEEQDRQMETGTESPG